MTIQNACNLCTQIINFDANVYKQTDLNPRPIDCTELEPFVPLGQTPRAWNLLIDHMFTFRIFLMMNHQTFDLEGRLVPLQPWNQSLVVQLDGKRLPRKQHLQLLLYV